MKLNTIGCGGYSIKNDRAKFSLYNTNLQEVSSLDTDNLTLYTDEGDAVSVIKGYTISTIDIDEINNVITLIMTRKLSDTTIDSIHALEDNFELISNKIKSIGITTSSIHTAFSPVLMRANLTDEEALNFASLYPVWQIGYDYKQGWIIQYDDSLYRIGQDHTSQEQWIPGEIGTEALYSKIEITEEGYEVWQEWDGVSGSYANGQIVKDPTDEQLYQSLIDNNVWGPPSTQPDYWQLYTES